MKGGFDFGDGARRPPAESIVPMINVVFLLLIFFLMTATITPPSPVPVEPPETRIGSDPVPLRETPLHLGAGGEIHWNGASGEAALVALAERVAAGGAEEGLTLRADRGADAAGFAALLGRLAELGITEVDLVVNDAPDGPGNGGR